jgi:hypothetical protein
MSYTKKELIKEGSYEAYIRRKGSQCDTYT